MLYPTIATLFALFIYMWTIINVSRARKRTGVEAPAVSGNPEFERYYRVQMNTLEQLVLFLPSLWLFALLYSPNWAGILGAGWGIGRILYAVGYYVSPKKRATGFMIAMFCNVALLFGVAWVTGVHMWFDGALPQ